MRLLGRTTGFGMVLVFIAVAPLALWTYNLQRILLDTTTYTTLFADKNFYEDLVPRVLPALIEGYNDEESPAPGTVELLDVINALPPGAWDRIARDLVPVEWVEYEIETNSDAFFGWLDGERNELEVVFNTDTLRRRLSSSPGDDAVRRMAEALPECTPADAVRLRQFVNGRAVEFPACYPQVPAQREQVVDLISDARWDAVDELPDALNVITELEAAADPNAAHDQPHKPFTRGDLDEFRATIALWRGLLPLTLLVPLDILSLIVIVMVRSRKVFFRWIGWAVLLGGLVSLIPLFVLPFIQHGISIESEVQPGFARAGDLLAEIVGERLVRLLIGEFTWPILIQASVLVVLGFVFVVLSVLTHDPDAAPDTLPGGAPDTTPTGAPYGVPASGARPSEAATLGWNTYTPGSSSHPGSTGATGSATGSSGSTNPGGSTPRTGGTP